MPVGLSEQETASTLETLERNMHSRGWEINPTKTQGACHMSKIFWVQWLGHSGTFHPSKGKDKLLHLATTITKALFPGEKARVTLNYKL